MQAHETFAIATPKMLKRPNRIFLFNESDAETFEPETTIRFADDAAPEILSDEITIIVNVDSSGGIVGVVSLSPALRITSWATSQDASVIHFTPRCAKC
jgi:hypothetical protein